MPKIRVLVVDDSVVIRKILTEILSSDPDIEVIGTAANGRIALQKIQQLSPDVVSLDIEMPELNGLDTIPLIRKDYPKLPIIIFSTLAERGAHATVEALSRGASDYVTKPMQIGSMDEARQAIKDELIVKIKSFVNHDPAPVSKSSPIKSSNKFPFAMEMRRRGPIEVVVIGISTGGPNALAKMLPMLPKHFAVPVLIVQHMPPMFTQLLAERLNAQSALHVVEAKDSTKIEAGTVYLAPGDFHLEVKQRSGGMHTALNKQPKENSCRPAADVLFRSVVPIYGSGVLSVVMTGMGQDGLIGCRHVKEAGGSVVVQDQESSVVWGMPGYVAAEGIADAIVPLEQIASEIEKRVTSSRTATLHAGKGQ